MGLAIRKSKPEIEVVGHDSNNDATKQAMKLGAIEKSEWNLISACESADLLILATPAMAVKDILTAAGAYLQKPRVVTDTASTKCDVMAYARKLLPDHVGFVGGDPIVGSADGKASPRADLFQGATYCLCPAPNASNEAIQLVMGLVDMLGATAYFVDPAEHDGYNGLADHLSFLTAASLLRMVALVGDPSKVPADLHRMIGPNFLRSAGFASSDPNTFRDLCLTNKDSMVRWIGEMRHSLDELGALIQEGDAKKIEALFNDVYVTRQVVSRAYRDPDQEQQSEAMRGANSIGIGDLFMGRRRTADKGKPDNKGKPANSGNSKPGA
jgi:prephenate dehydrogenase